MFWIVITICVLAVFALTWFGARFSEGGGRRQRDREDTPVLPMSDEDGPFV